MNPILYRAEMISPAIPLPPGGGETPFILGDSQPAMRGASDPDRHPIRHLLIGVPEAVHLTIHRLHQLGYVEAGLWSQAMGLSASELTLTVNPGEVMRVLRQVV